MNVEIVDLPRRILFLYYTNPVNAIIQRGKLRNSKFVVLLFVIRFSNISAITRSPGKLIDEFLQSFLAEIKLMLKCLLKESQVQYIKNVR